MRQTVWSFLLAAAWLSLPAALAQGIPQDGVWAQPQASIDVSGFDPYADPFAPQDPSLLPQSDPFAYPSNVVVDPTWERGPVYERFRVVHAIDFEYTMLARDVEEPGLGLDQLELSATFAFPFTATTAPLLIAPGFAIQWWDGPAAPFPFAGTNLDFPAQTYSAYLDVSWHPQITPWFGASLAVRPGIYSDFEDVDEDSFRIKGSGLAVFTLSPRWQVAAGIVYLDRNRVKLLPAGGAVWTPNDAVRWELVFPQPKLAQRLTVYGNTALWWYVGGEYGGDSWSMELHQFPGGAVTFRDQVDYNDIRVYLGLEWKPCEGVRGLSGHVEIGYVFDRELVRAGGPPNEYDLGDTLMLRGGIVY
jgi:hypothetical protein